MLLLVKLFSAHYTVVMPSRIHPSYSFVCFLIGIIAGDIITLTSRQVFITSPLWLVAAIFALLFTCLRPVWPMIFVSFFAGYICINYRASFDLLGQDYFQPLAGQVVTITGTITEDPDTTEQRTSLRLSQLQLINPSTSQTTSNPPESASSPSASTPPISVPGTLYAQLPPTSNLQRSDVITLKGKISTGFGTFAASIYRPSLTNISRPGDAFITVRDWFAGHITQHLSAEESALGLGYLLGMRSSLPPGLSETLRVVGLTHIIVASGANLSILIGFARKWLGKISRFTALFISIFLVLGYVGIVGLAPSMTRAGLVCILGLFTWYIGREFHPWRLLLIVAAITILISPMYIIDLGWLLSFASFAGILIFGPHLTHFFYADRQPNFLAATLLETISASLLCIPIILYFFGTISLVSLAANLLILPTISITMATTFLTGACFFLSPVSFLFGKISAFLLQYHLFVINFFGSQTLFLLEIPANNPAVFLLYLPIALPFIAKKLYNIIICHKKSPSVLNLRC